MRVLTSIGLFLCSIGLIMCMCSSPGVQKVSKPNLDVYCLQDGYYVRRLVVVSEVIYVKCDKEGNLLSGPISTHYGKSGSTTVIGE